MPGPHKSPHKEPKHRKPPKPHEGQKTVALLIAEHESPAANNMGEFAGEWVEFNGKKVDSFKSGGVSYEAFECTSYEIPSFRVYVSDKSNPSSPKYSLRPYVTSKGHPRDYSEPFTRQELINAYPMFAEKLGDFPVRQIDPDRN